jgi:3-demethoxyubiquinol 3-hydroxylase
MQRTISPIDRLLSHADNALRTLTPGTVKAAHPSPANQQESNDLSPEQKKHIAGLMRVNHTGEVCAQALYQGQSLTARLPQIRASMEQAADEELDHLAWCEQRINDFGNRTSLLNPLFYAMSYSLGAIAGAAGDKWSLGFVAATEDQVSLHLKDHLAQIGETDPKSSAVIRQMLDDEQRHSTNALAAGGVRFPPAVKKVMTGISKVMTGSAYRI